MSAYRSLTLILTLSCLVSNVAASELAYLPPAQSTPESQVIRAKNQLVWAEIPTLPSAPAASGTSISPTATANKNPLKSKFFRPFQARAPKETVAAADQTKLMQPSRVSAGKLLPSASSGTQNQTAQSSEIQTSRNFMDRLRQLSTGEEVKKPAPAPVVQAALSEEVASPSKNQVDRLVYAYDNSQSKDKSNPEIVLTQVYSEQLQHALSAIPAVETIEPTAKQPEFAPASIPYPEPEKIVFRPAVIDVNRYGQAVLRPDVLTAAQHEEMMGGGDMEALPPVAEPVIPEAWSAPLVSGTYQDYQEHCEPRLGPFQALYGRVCARLTGPCGCEPGLGTERVMHAISFVDTTQPMQNFRMRFDAGYDYQSPDRAEYFWARIGGRGPVVPAAGPAVPTVDYQDIRTYMEVGGDKFSVGTDVPIRIVDPSNGITNTSGIGDINITTKLLFLDGKDWQITNLFRTHIPSGDAARGLGVGHASIEPGFAMRYKYSNYTYFHGDLKYWVPLGGDPAQEGEVLNYGIAMSHVWRETDTFAVMPTIELRGYSFLDGRETVAANVTEAVDPAGVLIVHPGIRWAWDHGTDCGLREVGIFGGFALTDEKLYENLIRLEFRWNY